MNSTTVFLLFAAVFFAAVVTSTPVFQNENSLVGDVVVNPEDTPSDTENVFPVEEHKGGRFRRATCDLLSFTSKWVTINHSACAAHCLTLRKGYKGGYCKGTVCHCRK